MTDKLYRSHSLEKSADGTSGSLTVWEDSPVSPFDVGDTFRPVNGGPALTVDKVSIKDNVIGEINGRPLRQWEITIEGSNSASESTTTHVKYNFSISAGEKSGTMEVISYGDNPSVALNIGDIFRVPGIGQVFCSSVKGSDEYDASGSHYWNVIYEGANKAVILDEEAKYSLNIENNSDGVTVYSGSKEITCTGETPAISVSVGEKFSLPVVGQLTCTRVHSTNPDAGTWSVIIEGQRTGADSSGGGDDDTSLPDAETVITYEINGSTARTVAGEFLALRRSDTPIIKKSITVYTDSETAVASPGNAYQGGIVTSVNIVKETIKNNGVVTGSYYKHTLEVEA